MPTERVEFLGIDFDCLSFSAVMGRLANVTDLTAFSYLVTPNVDHVVMVNREPTRRRLYDRAVFCLCDSRILGRLGRLAGIRLPVVPGSELTRQMFSRLILAGDRIAIVGGNEHTLVALRSRYPGVEFVQHLPPMWLRTNASARQEAARFIATSRARFTFIAVGAPQQEMIAAETLDFTEATGLALCVGASLDFLTGQQRRAPAWVQRLGFEWAYRLVRDPKRLWRRYLIDDIKVFPIFVRFFTPRTRLKAASIMLLVAASAALAAYAWPSNRPEQSPRAATIGQPRQPGPIAINLPPLELVKALSPEEAAKENAERPFARRADRPALGFRLDSGAPGNGQAHTCMTQAVYYEAASEGLDGGRAVAQIVLNRMRHAAYPASVCAVVYQGAERKTGCQFSFTCDGSLSRVPMSSIWLRSRQIAQEALAGKVFDAVGHSTHYHADYVVPYWADSLDKAVQIGRHIFYRMRGPLGEGRLFRQRYSGKEVIPSSVPVIPNPLDALPLSPLKGVSELIAEEAVRELKSQEMTTASINRPIADLTSGSLILGEQTARLKQKTRQEVECERPDESKQVTKLQPNEIDAGSRKRREC